MTISATIKITHKNKSKLYILGYIGNINDIISIGLTDAALFKSGVKYENVCEICKEIFFAPKIIVKTCSHKCRAILIRKDESYNAKIKILFASDIVRKNFSNARRKQWQNLEYRERIIKLSKDTLSKPENRAKRSRIGKEKWKNESYANKMFNASVKYKNFNLPSGKIVKLQGYEPQVLTELLKIYSEDDIVIGVKEIFKYTGRIKYLMIDGSEHTYYPDFYIKSTNTIIEVKSQWTFDKWKEKNLAKEQACLQQGLKFDFKIIR
jgi:hypothetical protein